MVLGSTPGTYTRPPFWEVRESLQRSSLSLLRPWLQPADLSGFSTRVSVWLHAQQMGVPFGTSFRSGCRTSTLGGGEHYGRAWKFSELTATWEHLLGALFTQKIVTDNLHARYHSRSWGHLMNQNNQKSLPWPARARARVLATRRPSARGVAAAAPAWP